MDCPVTDSDIEFYRQNGFMQYKRFFSGQEMDRLRDVIDHAIAITVCFAVIWDTVFIAVIISELT